MHLGHDKHSNENKDTSNRRNGTISKSLRSSEYGEVTLVIPRDRKGEFESIIKKKNQTYLYGLENQIIAMYTKRLSTPHIQDYFSDLYVAEVPPTLVSNVINKILPFVREWQIQTLEVPYPIIFVDAIHFKVLFEFQIQSKPAYVVLGETIGGYKDILGIWIGESESSKFWLLVLNGGKHGGIYHPNGLDR